MKIKKRKGTFIVSALAFFMMALIFCCFAWDTARIMYYKVHNQNLASVIAISITNESGFFIPDSTGQATKGYLVTRKLSKGKKPKGFNGLFADDPSLLAEIKSKNTNAIKGNDFEVTDISVNSHYKDIQTFMTGSDGVNGEVKVVSTMKIKLFFNKIGTFFGDNTKKEYATIVNVATSKPIYHATGSIQVDWDRYEIYDGYVNV